MPEPQSQLVSTQWIYYGCNEEDEARIASCWRNTSGVLSSKTADVADIPSQVCAVAEKNDAEPKWILRATLQTPDAAIASEGAGETVDAAVDSLLFGLTQELDRLREEPATVVRERQGVATLAAALAGWRALGRSQAFISFLLPLMASIAPYVRRELRSRHIRGDSSGRTVSPYDVLDEVLLQAWEEFPNRNENQTLSLWLISLADQVIERLDRPLWLRTRPTMKCRSRPESLSHLDETNGWSRSGTSNGWRWDNCCRPRKTSTTGTKGGWKPSSSIWPSYSQTCHGNDGRRWCST